MIIVQLWLTVVLLSFKLPCNSLVLWVQKAILPAKGCITIEIHVVIYSRILLFSWFDSNVCTILRHLSLIAWFICELIHFIMSCPFLKGLLSFIFTLGNDGYLVFLYEQTLVFEMRNQTALQRVANLLQPNYL